MKQCPSCRTVCWDLHRHCPACGADLAEAPSPDGDPFIGATVGGKFVLRERIGVGSMAVVYRADQTNLGRTVAVKVLSPELAANPAMVRCFYEEARTASQLNHPCVVSVIDFGRTEAGILYLVMEFLHGRTVTRLIEEEAPIAPRRVVEIAAQVLDALHEAHCQGVVHRDLKTDNIMVERLRTGAELAKVLDFGIAKLRRGESGRDTLIGPCGTPAFMPPEQVRWERDLDGRADLYALAVVMYEMLTGCMPFAGTTPVEVIRRHLEEAPLPMRRARPDLPIPEWIDTIVLRALEKDRERRFASALAMKIALQSALAGRDVVTVRPRAPAVAPPPPSGFPLPLLPRPEWPRLRSLVHAHEGRALALVGPDGCGKTTLAAEAAREAGELGRACLRMAPDPTGAARSWYPVRELARALAEPGQNTQARVILDLAEGAGGEPADLEPDLRRSQCAAALLELLEAAVARAPHLVLIEDLDAFDAPTRDLVARLLDRPLPAGLAVLLTLRNGQLGNVEKLEVAGLSEAEVGTLARHALGPAGAAMVPELARTTRGLPLHVVELLRLGAEGGGAVPRGLADTIGARLGRLPPGARLLLQAVALAGGEAERTLLDAMGIEIDADAIALLEARGLAETSAASIRLRHRLLAEVARTDAPEQTRRQLHARLLQTRRAQCAEAAVLAHHAHEARAADAVALLEQAGEQAQRALDDAGAALHLRRALDLERWALLAGEPESEELMVRLSLKLAVALHQAGDTVTAEGVLREALREGREVGDPQLLGALYLGLATLHLDRGDAEAALAAAQEALREARRASSRIGEARAQALLNRLCGGTGARLGA